MISSAWSSENSSGTTSSGIEAEVSPSLTKRPYLPTRTSSSLAAFLADREGADRARVHLAEALLDQLDEAGLAVAAVQNAFR